MVGASEFQILLVDDNAADAKLFEEALRQAGTRVKLYWVATVEEAFEYLHGKGRFEGFGPVSLVVSDLSLPATDGFQFLSKLKKDPAVCAIPVVIFSSSRSPQDVQRSYQLGANSYVVKPMTLETLV